MTTVPFFQVDAFASRRFKGNPAAVMVMEDIDDSALMQGERVELEGHCIFFIEGKATI